MKYLDFITNESTEKSKTWNPLKNANNEASNTFRICINNFVTSAFEDIPVVCLNVSLRDPQKSGNDSE